MCVCVCNIYFRSCGSPLAGLPRMRTRTRSASHSRPFISVNKIITEFLVNDKFPSCATLNPIVKNPAPSVVFHSLPTLTPAMAATVIQLSSSPTNVWIAKPQRERKRETERQRESTILQLFLSLSRLPFSACRAPGWKMQTTAVTC